MFSYSIVFIGVALLSATGALNSRRGSAEKATGSIQIGGETDIELTQSKDCPSPDKSGWEIEELKGSVRLLKEEAIDFSYRLHSKELKRQMTFDRSGNYKTYEDKEFPSKENDLTSETPTFKFDSACHVVERRGLSGEWGMTRTTYSYAPTGALKEETIYDLQDRMVWRSVSELNDSGKPTETKDTIQVHPEHFNPKRFDVYRETKSYFKYDAKGNLIEQVDYKYDGSLYATYHRVYDDANRLIRLTRLDDKERGIDQSIYKFDKVGKLIEERKYTSFEYSDVDDLVPGKIDSGFGLFQHGSRIVYEYDKNDNWVKRTEYDIDKAQKLRLITFRTLFYF